MKYSVSFSNIVDIEGEPVSFDEGDIYVEIEAQDSEDAKYKATTFLVDRIQHAPKYTEESA